MHIEQKTKTIVVPRSELVAIDYCIECKFHEGDRVRTHIKNAVQTDKLYVNSFFYLISFIVLSIRDLAL